SDGMRFSDFYVSAPRCTPARASLLTGMSAAKLGMTYVNEGGRERRGAGRGGRGGEAAGEPTTATKLVPPTCRTELAADVTTIAELLRGAGYATAHFGKWHVGRERPSRHGFDVDDGANTNRGPGGNDKPNPEEGTAITDRGLEFVRARAAAKQPFYLQMSHYGGGSEDESRPETRMALAAELRGLRGKGAWQAAILRDLDDQIGRIVTALAEQDLADDTYVVVVFDHGAAGRNTNAPLRGGKGSVHEGGIRVPFLVRGPGVAGNVSCHVRASTADVLPTIADLAGVTRWPDAVEGGSLAAVLRGRGTGPVARPREEIVVHFPHYDLGSTPASALFLGDHKLVRRYEDGVKLLYDIVRDPEENHDLAAAEPARLAELERRLDAYLKSIEAPMPSPNPDHGRDK
ncbi:MAG: sulfatase-like hydrolase/transferase, partial [Planctomycetes bacterium]|nr:sulfatase-like hydrolase/transferase [Planctomycetota bacterium]